ncbi:MAG: sugar phosphate isomerase/epimerase family protein [Verrucomicrobiales bacterium]
MQRRYLLKSGALAGAGFALSGVGSPAIEPVKRKGKARLRLSVAAYSFRQHFRWMKGREQKAAGRAIDMREFIDLCAGYGCDGTELTSYFFRGGADDAYYRDLRRYAFLKGIGISGTAVGNNFALPEGQAREEQIAAVKGWIDRAAVLGAPHIRVFAGSAKGIDDATARRMCVSALEECCDYAGSKGIFLGLENHGGIVAQAAGMLEIIAAVKSPWFGVNLDTGNFHTEDPYGDLAKVVPYALNVQVKVEMRAAGQKEKEPADMKRLVKILSDSGYQGYVALEYEAKGDPFKEVPLYLDALRGAIGA